MTDSRTTDTIRAEAVERLAVVATLRAKRGELLALMAIEDESFAVTVAPLTKGLAEVKAQLDIAENEAKVLALDLYFADPTNKKPVPGAAIRVKKGVEYEYDDAFDWANGRGLFVTAPRLDQKAFDAFLLTHPETPGLSYEITETPTVALDSALPLPENV